MRKLVITLFCITLLIPSRGNTLGLGEIELHSALNEELKAEIALTSIGQESVDTIIVQLASREAFARAGIERLFILNDLSFKVLLRNGQPYIEVTSKKAIREPFLSFLLDIDWPRGHLLREFTMLLDPPVFTQTSADGSGKTVVAPQSNVNVNGDTSRPAYNDAGVTNSQAMAPAAMSDRAMPQVQQQQAPQTQQSVQAYTQNTRSAGYAYQMPADAYRVQKNDTAWKIAEQMRANSSISVEQMMMALLRRNPEAFINDNINGVKRGYILRMPNEQEVRSLDQQTAVTQVREQYALWREYHQAMVAKRSGNKISREAGATDTAQADTKQGRLTISSAAEGAGSTGATSGSQSPESQIKQLRQELAATSEELESGKLENTELKERVKSLQARMKKMERLLNLKDGDLAQLQSDIEPVAEPETAAPEAAATAEIMPATTDMAETAPVEEAAPADAMQNETSMPADTTAPMDGMAESKPADEVLFADETAEPVAEQAAPVITPQEPMAPIVVGKTNNKDFIEELLNDPNSLLLVAGGPAGLVLLIALWIVMRRRKAKKAEVAAVASLPETGDFNFDEVADLVSNEQDYSEESEEDLENQLDSYAEEAAKTSDDETVISLDDDQVEEETPKDDVLAEADVYLAYGIYQQAEELLRTAVDNNPDRNDYKIKLLETYFASKDKSNFVSVAEDLHTQINTESPDWQRVVAMGRELDSGNDLFRDSGEVSNFDMDDLLPKRPETDFDLGDDNADFDLGEAIDEDEEFDLGLDDDSLDDDQIAATVALSPEEASAFAVGGSAQEDSDNFALNDDGMDELDQELAELDDFDAGEMEFGLDEMEMPAQEEAVEEDLDEGFSLDFEVSDLGLDEADAEISFEETEAVASALEPEVEEMNLDMAAGLDDDLSADLEDDFSAGLDEVAAVEDDSSLDMDLGGIDLSDAATDMEDVSLDMDDASDSLSLDMEAGEIDFSSMEDDSDLGMAINLADDDDTTVVTSMQDDEDDIDIMSLPDDLDEINTKLDLARAYIDMGDNDGASSILREVIEEAGSEQKQVAEEMLKNIA